RSRGWRRRRRRCGRKPEGRARAEESRMIESLAVLLSPHDPALLDAAMLRRERLHLRTGQAERYAGLLPWAVFNGLPSVEGLNNTELRILQKGRNVLYDMLVEPRDPGRRRRLSP